MKKSKILKIEDVLPHITDTIKIEEFKKQISNCINEYEENIKKLKEDINDYNKTAENIKNDVYKVKKKSMEIQYSSCKCEICQSYIKDKNIYLFPCGHMFDLNCIRESLLKYQFNGLTHLKQKNLRIDELFYDLGLIKERTFELKGMNTFIKSNEEEKKMGDKQQNVAGGFLGKIRDLKIFDKQDNPLANLPPQQVKAMKDELNNLLSEQCVLCGDYMVDSIQFSLYDKNEDNKKFDDQLGFGQSDIDKYVVKKPNKIDWELISDKA